MAAAGRVLKEEELVEYKLAGLDVDFIPVMTAVTTRSDPVPAQEVYAQLLAFETRMNLQGSGYKY